MKDSSCKVYGLSLGTTMGVAYILCAIYDMLFPPYGFLAFIAPASPWPIMGGVTGFITGLVMFSVMGFVLGAIYGVAQKFWSKKLK